MAARIMQMPAPAASRRETSTGRMNVAPAFRGRVSAAQTQGMPHAVQRAQERLTVNAPKADPSFADAETSRDIEAGTASGSPLPIDVREFMEPRFGADFGGVKIHADESAHRLSARLGARAFAYRNHIFFGGGEYRPQTEEGRALLAHELTHTIQQQAVVQRREEAVVSHIAPVQVQRLGLDTVLNYIADKANIIPGFRLFTIVLGVNPINMNDVDASPANVLRAAIEFMPGGGLITQALDNSGIFEKVADWVAQQVKALGMVGSAIKQALTDFLKTLGPSDFLSPGAAWERAKGIFTGPIDQIKNTVKGFVSGIIDFVKEAILKPIAKLAEGTPSYDLLKGVMGKDPITGETADDSADLMIGGFMKLIGQQDVWENMQKSGAVAKAWAWFKGALADLKAFVLEIPPTFIAAFKSLELIDIVLVPRAFAKLAGVFGNFLGRFISWAGEAVWNLLEIIFNVVKPGAMAYVKKTGGALKGILKNPLPFVGNLGKAAKLGFQNFGSNFLTHLKAGLLDWLTGSLPGVYIPKALSLPEFGKLALSVLGLSWAQIRAKIVKALGPNGEKIMQGLEAAFDVIKALVTGGPAAAWKVIQDKLTNLKDTIVDGIISFIKEAVVTKAIPKLVAMFIPGAGFISAIISIYDMVMVFVQKIAKIIQVVTAFIDSIVAIAGGAIGAAAAKVESILAGLLSLAINFLAGFAGLGKAADKVRGVITKVRDTVDKALDTAVNFIVGKAKALFGSLFGSGKGDERTPAQKQADLDKAMKDARARQSAPQATEVSIRAGLGKIKSQYKMKSLDLVVDSKDDAKEKLHIAGEINPTAQTPVVEIPNTQIVGPLGIVRKMLSWEESTLKHFFTDQIWAKVMAVPGDYKSAEIDIRHKVSISDTIKNTDNVIKPKTVDAAATTLADKGYPVQGKKEREGIVATARKFLQKANNDISNLFLGSARPNRSIGKKYDPGDGGDAASPVHNQQKSDFVDTWGFKDEEFVITIERQSKKRGTTDVTETRTSKGNPH